MKKWKERQATKRADAATTIIMSTCMRSMNTIIMSTKRVDAAMSTIMNMGMESMNTITMSTKQRHPGRRFQCRRVLKRECIYLRIWAVPTVPPRWSA